MRLRNTIFFPLLWGLLGLHFLNTSVDFEDPSAVYLPEDLTYNDQESFVEIFIEKVLGYEHAIAEHDDQDRDHQQKKKSNTFDFYWCVGEKLNQQPQVISAQIRNYFVYSGVEQNGSVRIDPPPPKS